MTELREYRGIPYSIPSNDDGVWLYKLHPGRLGAKAQRPSAAPADGYNSRSEAITAAQKAVDDWLGRATS